MTKFKYLPETPDHIRDVLVAVLGKVELISAYYIGGKWIASNASTSFMKKVDVQDATFRRPELIYAWCEMPQVPKPPKEEE